MGDLAKMMSDLHYLYTYIIYIADMLYRRITLLYPESALAYQFLTSDVFLPDLYCWLYSMKGKIL